MSEDMKPVWNDEFQCDVISLKYTFDARCGILLVADGHCVDMPGTIEFFKRIDPNVEIILTGWDAGTPDTTFIKRGKEWVAFTSEIYTPKIRAMVHALLRPKLN